MRLNIRNEKHHEMVIQLAEKLSEDNIHHRKLYRFLNLEESEMKMVESNKSESDKIYDTLAFYVGSKNLLLTELIHKLNMVRDDPKHIDFVKNYHY